MAVCASVGAYTLQYTEGGQQLMAYAQQAFEWVSQKVGAGGWCIEWVAQMVRLLHFLITPVSLVLLANDPLKLSHTDLGKSA